MALFQFGVELLRPLATPWRWLKYLPGVILLLWIIFPFRLCWNINKDVTAWQTSANTLSRYLLCVPGAFLAGIALQKQVHEQIHPLNIHSIERMLHIAAASLIAYAIFGGVIVPKTNFFPASLINVEIFKQVFILPVPIFRSIAGITLAYALIRASEVFEVETRRLIYQMEENIVIANERERIGRDIHDGVLQQIYATGLLAQSLRKQVNNSTGEKLDQLINAINQSIEQLRHFISHDQISIQTVELIPALESILDEARRFITIETQFNTPRTPQLTPEQINHLSAFTHEALSNAIRHAQTSKLEIKVDCQNQLLTLSIRDFGKGMGDNPEPGFGIRNMRDRARLLGANLTIQSKIGIGTLIKLEIPLKEKCYGCDTCDDRG
ncbi:MAG: sensor histidine kinase [Anaerolineales bacterium]